MMKAPASLCVIVKNDPILERCISSLRDYVEEVVIVDTGSTPENQAIAKGLADTFELYTECNDPETGQIESFSKARQRSFDLATKEWVIWADSDDIVVGGERLAKLTSSFVPNAAVDSVAFMFPYEYAYDSNGNCICRHYRERLVYRSDYYHWRNPVHEVLVMNDGAKCYLNVDESVTYKHQRQYSSKPQDPGRNLRILKKYVEGEGKDDARQLYYIGLEYCNNGMINEAIASLTKYIEISGWDDERIMACLKLVDIYSLMINYQEALRWGFKAIELGENWSEGYLAVGKMFYYLAMNGGHNKHRNWQRCVHFIRTGLSMPPTRTLLFTNPLEREFDIHKYLNYALNEIGDVKGALDSANMGLKVQSDGMLLANKCRYEHHLATQQIVASLDTMKNIGTLDDTSIEFIMGVINKNIVVTNHSKGDKYDIVFFIGSGVEVWTPKTVENTGIGGSEIMAIEMSKRLAKLGHRVRVYSGCGDNGEGIYDGVEYYQTAKYHNIECDVLIVSRYAPMISDQYISKAKLRLLWVHDIFSIAATPELLAKYDKLLVLSEWHKLSVMQHHNIGSDRIIVTRNGIDLGRFKKDINRNRYKVVNSSSPDRYLPSLLDCWPEIKAKVPEATLDIFYGFKNWEFVARNDPNQLNVISALKLQMKEMKDLGVVFRDRVNQTQLAEEFLSAGVWAYSTWFSETSCLSAMEAQAAGLRIVTSPVAALNETVGNRGTMIEGDWLSSEYKAKFTDAVVNALQKTDNSDRLALQEYAKNFDLDTLAKEWEQMLTSLINPQVADIDLVPYQDFQG